MAATTGRRRSLPPLLVLVGVALAAGGALLPWWTVRWEHLMLGEQVTELSGREAAPATLALAGVCLAGLVAVAAARRWWRRVFGGAVLAAALGGLLATVVGTVSVPASVIVDNQVQAQRVLDGTVHIGGPIVASVGAIVAAGGGLLILLGGFAGAGMGGRFDRRPPAAAPVVIADAAVGDSTAPAIGGQSAAALAANADAESHWWRSLDGGLDPTAEPSTELVADSTDDSATDQR